MITHSFHEEKDSLFSPEVFFGERNVLCDTAIATFSHEIFETVLQRYPHQAVAHTGSVNGHRPVYRLHINGRSVIFYLSSIGACLAGNDVIEIQWQTGFRRLILFGSAGALDSDATQGKYVIPTQAYRDEGMSYHYAPPSDFIHIPNSKVLSSIFDRLRLPYVQGKTWTTDAPYRETRYAVTQRKQEGCLTVEMELAGVQAVCNFYGIELYSFLVTGDILDAEVYNASGLKEANHAMDKFFVALDILERLPSMDTTPLD